jgi:predicted RND superfamily exporter protein
MLTLVDLVGTLHFWDVTIDVISCVNIVLATGLCVDYSVHIAHAFSVAEGSRIERTKAALVNLGPAIVNGGVTTFLAVIILPFSQSHVFQTFFKIFGLTVIYGVFHGLVFLPALLSTFGPHSSEKKALSMEKSGESGDNHSSVETSSSSTASSPSPKYSSKSNGTINSGFTE